LKLRDWIAKRFGTSAAPGIDPQPESAERFYSLGASACDAGRTGEAIELIAQAIRLNGAVARYHYKLGVALQAAGEPDQASERYRQALALDGGYAKAYNNLGSLLHAQGRFEEAIANYEKALALEPGLGQAARNLGIAWLERGDAARAEHFARYALRLDPTAAEPYVHLARAHRHLGKPDEALAACIQAVALEPDFAQARYEQGRALKELGRWDDAIAAYRTAIALEPRSAEAAEAWVSIGVIDELTGRPGAMEHSRIGVSMQPDLAHVRHNYALHLLLAGDYANGWREYEWRWRLPEYAGLVPRFERPHWDGSPVAGKSLLLYAEQGYGDAIQFFRYAPLVAQRGGEVLVCCSRKLAPLFRNTPGIARVVADDEPLPAVDLFCPLLSLPRIFETTLDSVPSQVPYVFADAERAQRWRGRLAARNAALKVGLCWATESRSRSAALRSLELEMLAPLAAIPGVEFYSLQRGSAAAQAAHAPAGMKLVDLAGELRDFADDAALIAALDLVISSDTATAHLAGAMGRPVWTLTSFPPDWRWMLEREDSPWYPSMRLFRQRRMRDWTDVVRQVAATLERLAS
jgi:tetratricopeptide (TPR) repeat protein